jgi:hypothetical protein
MRLCVYEPLVGVAEGGRQAEGGSGMGGKVGKIARSLSVRWYGHEGWWVGRNEVMVKSGRLFGWF